MIRSVGIVALNVFRESVPDAFSRRAALNSRRSPVKRPVISMTGFLSLPNALIGKTSMMASTVQAATGAVGADLSFGFGEHALRVHEVLKPAAEADIQVAVPAGAQGISIQPTSGSGELQCSISATGDQSQGPCTITVTASAGGQQITEIVKVSVDQEYQIEFY